MSEAETQNLISFPSISDLQSFRKMPWPRALHKLFSLKKQLRMWLFYRCRRGPSVASVLRPGCDPVPRNARRESLCTQSAEKNEQTGRGGFHTVESGAPINLFAVLETLRV